ncbi:MAG: transposase [Elusimicrobia bacterium]|nr:transposase [Elusimicrobiota bacterium]
MSRIARVFAIGYPHHITQRGNNKQRVFLDNHDKKFYLSTLKKYSQKYNIQIWGYCLMDNHVHLICVPAHDYSLARGIGGTNLIYTQYFNKKYNCSGRLWQNRFFSCIVDKNEYLFAAMKYIETNPIRGGMTKYAEEYNWSSAGAHLKGYNDEILDKERIEVLDINTYKKYFFEMNEELNNRIRKCTSAGRPFGGNSFLSVLEKKLNKNLILKKAGRPKKRK